MNLEIIFENDDLIAFNKPTGLLSIPDRFDATIPNLYHLACAKFGKLMVIHRLDKDTSGIICFAKNEDAHRFFNQLFENREVEKYYLAIVMGRMPKEKGSIIEPIAENTLHRGTMLVNKRGKFAHTDYEALQVWKAYSLVRLQLHTGRTHQIRVHLKFMGFPIVADPIYNEDSAIKISTIKKHFKLPKKTVDEVEERPLLNRLALHASMLKMKDEKGNEVIIEAPLPKDMSVTVKQLDKWN